MVGNDASDFSDDPRLSPRFVRTIEPSGDKHPVVLVGVVHDHPASIYRVQHVLTSVEPTVLALELPPLAVPLFDRYATDTASPPALGGEMSAAIQAAPEARTVGIDAPNWRFLRALVQTVEQSDVSVSNLHKVFRRFTAVLGHAAVCRVAATLLLLTSVRFDVTEPVDHQCSFADSPSDQAEDELNHISLKESFFGAIHVPQSILTMDRAREDSMATSLTTLCEEGPVVAVVGYDHLEGVSEQLSDSI